MPTGVVIAKRIIKVTWRRENSLPPPCLDLGLPLVPDFGREDIRIPRERPSKSWWNIIAVTSDAAKWAQNLSRKRRERSEHILNSGPDVITRVNPMTSEWIIIPVWRTWQTNQLPRSDFKIECEKSSTHKYTSHLSLSTYSYRFVIAHRIFILSPFFSASSRSFLPSFSIFIQERISMRVYM